MVVGVAFGDLRITLAPLASARGKWLYEVAFRDLRIAGDRAAPRLAARFT